MDYTIGELQKRWYIDDEMFAKLYIQSELVNKGKPSVIIIQKLIFKWVDKSIVKKLMTQFEAESTEWIHERIRKEIDKLKKQGNEWVEIIQKLLRRWYKLKEIKECLTSPKD